MTVVPTVRRGAGPTGTSEAESLLDALLAGLPDGLIVCDRYLAPVRASAAARWLLAAEGGWARGSAPVVHVQAAAAAALDRGGVATVAFDAAARRWEARAAPLAHARAAVVVVVRPLAEFDEQRDQILHAAHDLKAPIHALEGFTKLLLREAAGPLTAEQRRFLEIATSEAGRLKEHLDQLLDVVRFAQPTAGQTEAVVADVATVVDDAAARLTGAVQAKHIELQVPGAAEGEPHLVAMPEEELSTIIENLLNNAISATPAEGTIRIEVERTPQGTVRCTVADTGPGIPEAALERVFDPYYRIPERGAAGGTGLGLAISRRLADARGGRLLAANRPTGGAIFTLELPAAEAGARKWPVLHLAPVTSHAGLAAARAALDMHLPGPWRVLSWEGGVLAVEVEVQPAQAHKAAGDVADATDFACWLGGP